tara:strand:+ start:354 stop:1511 length:1158 start_codon:yes stop_codon:yes gene_type:complete
MDKYTKGVLAVLVLLTGCQTTGLKEWGENKNIPSSYRPNLETVRHHFQEYNTRGTSYRFDTDPSPTPRALEFSLRTEPKVQRELNSASVASYLMYENERVVIDEMSPDGRLGDLIDNETMIYSMSLGKSLGGYLIGHAICKGYIESVDSSLSDWPLVAGTLLEQATVRDVINATMGDQRFVDNNDLSSGRDVGDVTIRDLVINELASSDPSPKRYNYGQLPANVAFNYISYKTGHQFKTFLNEIMREHVGLNGTLKLNHISRGEEHGPIQANFKATRYDTLRIGIAILEDWKDDTCVGKYLKDVYANRVPKGRFPESSATYAKSYAGFFHTDYRGIDDVVMGMEGYGGIRMLINFTDQRIIYIHSVHRDYDRRGSYLKPIETGQF